MRHNVFAFAATFLSFLSSSHFLTAQGPAGAAVAMPVAQANRLAAAPDLTARTKLSGHLPAWVRTAADLGPTAATDILKLDIVLTRAPGQQAAFEQLLTDQQTPTSPRYRHWLTAQQIGEQYGPTQDDVAAIVAWLTTSGMQIDEVTPSRIFLRVSARPSSIATAFSTPLHRFRIAGDTPNATRLAATVEPEIPAAFASLIASIAGLSETPDTPQARFEFHSGPVLPGMTPSIASTAIVKPTAATHEVAAPDYTSSSTGKHYITPGDFAVLYNVTPVYNSGIDGTGQRVAIMGRSRVNAADILNFEIATNSPSRFMPNTIVPPAGVDPGVVSGDQGEATLDVQRVIGTAPGAPIDLVISSVASGGIRTAAQYNIQTLADPIMNISFGSCEASAGLANTTFYANLFAQGAAEGITTFISSGDAGAAGCDSNFAVPPATQIASINYFCSSGYATCVGGTEFEEGSGNYWNATNTSSRVSALSYIPEGAWNDSLNYTSNGVPIFVAAAGGGGASIYTAKPSFQTGLGVPADGVRDTPDVSFSAASHDPYFFCLANGITGSCTVDPATNLFYYGGSYGTSAAAPSLAGITALLNQKQTSAQGNLNPLIYKLAATNPAVFHDVTVASSGVSGCTVSVPSMCNNSTPSPTASTGGLAGYAVNTGYDLATGWGSLDVYALLTASAGLGTATNTSLTNMNGAFGVSTGATLNFSVQVSPAGGNPQLVSGGTVQMYANGVPFGPAYPVGLLSNGYSGINILLANPLPAGTYIVTAQYSGNGSFDASISAPAMLSIITPGLRANTIQISATVSGLTATLAGTVTGPTGNLTPAPSGTVTYNVVANGASTAKSINYLSNYGTYSTTGSLLQLPVGTYAIQAVYAGDSVYAPSTSNVVSATTTPNLTSVMLSAGVQTVTTSQTISLQATVNTFTTLPVSSSLNFMDGTIVLATVPLAGIYSGLSAAITFTAGPFSAGSHTFTAVYQGDANTQRSTSNPATITVTAAPAITLAAANPSITSAAGATSGNTDMLTLTSVGGFSGSVTLGCSVASNNGTAAIIPSCLVSPAALSIAAGGTGSASVSILTTKASAITRAATNHIASVVYALLLGWIPFAWRSRQRRTWPPVACLVSLALLIWISGCGGNSSSGAAPIPGTTAGSYTITVTASGSGISTTLLTIPLTIQ